MQVEAQIGPLFRTLVFSPKRRLQIPPAVGFIPDLDRPNSGGMETETHYKPEAQTIKEKKGQEGRQQKFFSGTSIHGVGRSLLLSSQLAPLTSKYRRISDGEVRDKFSALQLFSLFFSFLNNHMDNACRSVSCKDSNQGDQTIDIRPSKKDPEG